MKTKTMPLHMLIMSTVAAITFSGTEDLENARFVKRLTTEGTIPPEKTPEVLRTIDAKLDEVGDDGQNTQFYQTISELQAARSGVEAQFLAAKKMFDDASVHSDSGFTETKIDPAIAGRAKKNGAAHAMT